MYVTTFDELSLVFSQYRRFANPFDSYASFPERIVNKLYNLAEKNGCTSFKETMDQVRLFLDNSTQTANNFVRAYSQLDEENKESVEKALGSLNNLAMYMRGWNGEGQYPLENTESDMEVVEAKVAEELVSTKNCLEQCTLKEQILALPLVRYDNVRKEWITSTDTEAGLTIGDRLDIVNGQSDTNIHSCIRSSSNWFASSAYLYMKMIKNEELFDISRMRTIA